MSITDPTKTGDERKNAGAHVGLVVPASYKSYITHIYIVKSGKSRQW
jgi:hypothetical protein